jgi:type I site-specific restriction-modification system R (restriction) subunit
LDKYFIDEAEKDGFVVPIIYELRKEEVKLKDEDLEWYIKEITPDDISDELELKNLDEQIRKRINEVTVILENKKKY